jgi:hypothetical protein
MNQPKFPFEDDIMQLAPGQNYVIHLNGQAFIITPATDEAVEKIGHGFYCMD